MKIYSKDVRGNDVFNFGKFTLTLTDPVEYIEKKVFWKWVRVALYIAIPYFIMITILVDIANKIER